MSPFDFYFPYSLDEALSLLSSDDPDVRPVGGGTAVWLMMKAGVLTPSRLVSLQNIEQRYSEVRVNEHGELVIGGLATLGALERNVQVRRGWPLIARALQTLANVRVRSVATLGGNLSHADPHMDMPPVLAALGARITIAGPGGEHRTVPADDFCTGYYETVLFRNELVVGVTVPPQIGVGAYMKLTTRARHDWPALGLAVSLGFEGDRIVNPSVVLGAATDRPTRLVAAQRALDGQSYRDEKALADAGERAVAEVDIVSDPHGSAAYKRHLLKTTLVRAVRQITATLASSQ